MGKADLLARLEKSPRFSDNHWKVFLHRETPLEELPPLQRAAWKGGGIARHPFAGGAEARVDVVIFDVFSILFSPRRNYDFAGLHEEGVSLWPEGGDQSAPTPRELARGLHDIAGAQFEAVPDLAAVVFSFDRESGTPVPKRWERFFREGGPSRRQSYLQDSRLRPYYDALRDREGRDALSDAIGTQLAALVEAEPFGTDGVVVLDYGKNLIWYTGEEGQVPPEVRRRSQCLGEGDDVSALWTWLFSYQEPPPVLMVVANDSDYVLRILAASMPGKEIYLRQFGGRARHRLWRLDLVAPTSDVRSALIQGAMISLGDDYVEATLTGGKVGLFLEDEAERPFVIDWGRGLVVPRPLVLMGIVLRGMGIVEPPRSEADALAQARITGRRARRKALSDWEKVLGDVPMLWLREDMRRFASSESEGPIMFSEAGLTTNEASLATLYWALMSARPPGRFDAWRDDVRDSLEEGNFRGEIVDKLEAFYAVGPQLRPALDLLHADLDRGMAPRLSRRRLRHHLASLPRSDSPSKTVRSAISRRRDVFVERIGKTLDGVRWWGDRGGERHALGQAARLWWSILHVVQGHDPLFACDRFGVDASLQLREAWGHGHHGYREGQALEISRLIAVYARGSMERLGEAVGEEDFDAELLAGKNLRPSRVERSPATAEPTVITFGPLIIRTNLDPVLFETEYYYRADMDAGCEFAMPVPTGEKDEDMDSTWNVAVHHRGEPIFLPDDLVVAAIEALEQRFPNSISNPPMARLATLSRFFFACLRIHKGARESLMKVLDETILEPEGPWAGGLEAGDLEAFVEAFGLRASRLASFAFDPISTPDGRPSFRLRVREGTGLFPWDDGPVVAVSETATPWHDGPEAFADILDAVDGKRYVSLLWPSDSSECSAALWWFKHEGDPLLAHDWDHGDWLERFVKIIRYRDESPTEEIGLYKRYALLHPKLLPEAPPSAGVPSPLIIEWTLAAPDGLDNVPTFRERDRLEVFLRETANPDEHLAIFEQPSRTTDVMAIFEQWLADSGLPSAWVSYDFEVVDEIRLAGKAFSVPGASFVRAKYEEWSKDFELEDEAKRVRSIRFEPGWTPERARSLERFVLSRLELEDREGPEDVEGPQAWGRAFLTQVSRNPLRFDADDRAEMRRVFSGLSFEPGEEALGAFVPVGARKVLRIARSPEEFIAELYRPWKNATIEYRDAAVSELGKSIALRKLGVVEPNFDRVGGILVWDSDTLDAMDVANGGEWRKQAEPFPLIDGDAPVPSSRLYAATEDYFYVPPRAPPVATLASRSDLIVRKAFAVASDATWKPRTDVGRFLLRVAIEFSMRGPFISRDEEGYGLPPRDWANPENPVALFPTHRYPGPVRADILREPMGILESLDPWPRGTRWRIRACLDMSPPRGDMSRSARIRWAENAISTLWRGWTANEPQSVWRERIVRWRLDGILSAAIRRVLYFRGDSRKVVTPGYLGGRRTLTGGDPAGPWIHSILDAVLLGFALHARDTGAIPEDAPLPRPGALMRPSDYTKRYASIIRGFPGLGAYVEELDEDSVSSDESLREVDEIFGELSRLLEIAILVPTVGVSDDGLLTLVAVDRYRPDGKAEVPTISVIRVVFSEKRNFSWHFEPAIRA